MCLQLQTRAVSSAPLPAAGGTVRLTLPANTPLSSAGLDGILPAPVSRSLAETRPTAFFEGETQVKRNYLFLALFAAATAAVLGCSGKTGLKGLVPVSGIVTLKGAPLAGAVVSFVPVTPGARAAAATTDPEGRFKLTTLVAEDGAAPGEYQVTVSKTETIGKTYTPEEANEYYNKNMKSPPSPEMKNVVAEKFSKAGTSGLKASVKAGDKNEFTFDVE